MLLLPGVETKQQNLLSKYFLGIMSLISIEIIDLLVVSGQPWVPP